MSLVKEIIKGLLPEEEKRTIAVYGGGFKPPTAGHFEVVETAIKKNPNIDKFIILIGGKERDGVTPEESIIIWDIYKQYLPVNVEVKLSPKPPIQAVYNYAKEHPDEDVIFVIGAREGNEDDFKDISIRTTSVDKYPNLRVETVVTQGGASGTAARNAAKVSVEKLKPLLPKQLKDEEVDEIFGYLSNTVMEEIDLEKAPEKSVDLKTYGDLKLALANIKKDQNLKKFKDVGGKAFSAALNLLPGVGTAIDAYGVFKAAFNKPDNVKTNTWLDKLDVDDDASKIVDDTVENEFLKVAADKFMDEPDDKVLDPNFNMDNELNNHLKGKFNARHVGGVNEAIEKINYTNPNFRDEWEEAIRYPEFKEMGIKNWIKIANKGYITNYSKIKDKLGNVDLKFNSLEEPKKQRFQDALNKGNIEMSIAVKFSDNDYDLVAGNTRISGLVKNQIDPKIWIVDLSNDLNEAIVGEKIECDNCGWSWNIVDGGDDLFICHKCGHDNDNTTKELNILKEILDPTNFDFKPLIKSLTVSMEKDGLTLKPYPKVKFIHTDFKNADNFFGKTAYYNPNTNEVVLYTLGRHPKDILRSYAHELVHVHQNHEDRLHDIQTDNVNADTELEQLEREAYETGNIMFRSWTNTDPFDLSEVISEIAEEEKYYIYLDMDGVVADFDKRFNDLSGMMPQDYVNKNGLNDFWNFIDEKHKVAFWRGIELMPDAQKLVSYIEQHPFEMLTAPSIKKQSVIGKGLWVKDKVGTLYSTKPKVTYRSAKQKHTVKPNLTKFDILIDDKGSTIDRWDAAGGTAILYQNANQVINDLKKLGL